jgi:myosin-crossreactive antigen
MKHETFFENENQKEKAQELIKLLASSCENLGDVQSLLKNLFKGCVWQYQNATFGNQKYNYQYQPGLPH